MGILVAVFGLGLILLVLVDGFESIILPRRVMRPYRFARFFYRKTWNLWGWLARRIRPGKHRETFLSVYGPLSLLGLFASWVLGLIVGFGLLHWSLGIPLRTPDGPADLGGDLYMSGTTLFTLGLGDITPVSPLARLLTVIEAGMGFAFLACIISYLPVLYQSFSNREVTISLLDARAGSPPSASQVLIRAAQGGNTGALASFLAEWEHWAAELLESHLSYPVLSFYRSQHDNQSWLGALTAILDTSALVLAAVKDVDHYQAQLTFAMARHVAVDISLVFQLPPVAPDSDRLPTEEFQRLRASLTAVGLIVLEGPEVEVELAELRKMYEPFVTALARHLMISLPVILSDHPVDNWQSSAWTARTPGIGKLVAKKDEHFR